MKYLCQILFSYLWLALTTANVQFTEHFIKLGDPWQVDCDTPYKEAPSWYFVSADRSYNHYVYNYGKLENRGSVRYNVTQKAEGTWTLEVSHTTYKHAGYYGCWPDPTIVEGRQFYKLIIIEYFLVELSLNSNRHSNLIINITFVSHDVLTPVFQCTFHYGTSKMNETICHKFTNYTQLCYLKKSFDLDDEIPQKCKIVFNNVNFKVWKTKSFYLIAKTEMYVVKKGSSLNVSCETTSMYSMKWLFDGILSHNKSIVLFSDWIQTSHQIESRYFFNYTNDRRIYTMFIPSVDLNHTGTYMCTHKFSENLIEKKIDLLVLDHFSINFYPYPSKVEMFITYLGSNQMIPQFKCFINNELLMTMGDAECKINKNGFHWCRLIDTYDDVEGVIIKCGIWFGNQIFKEKEFMVKDIGEPLINIEAFVILSIVFTIVTITVAVAVGLLLWIKIPKSRLKEDVEIMKPLLQTNANEEKQLQESRQILSGKLQEVDKIIEEHKVDNENKKVDLEILVDINNDDRKSIGVHQTVLNNCCENMKIKFNIKSKYGNHSVDLTHFNTESVMNIVMFAYTGDYKFNEKNYENDFNTAKDLGVVRLAEKILNCIFASINANNFMDIYKFSKSYQNCGFHKNVKDHIVLNFHTLIANFTGKNTCNYEDFIEIASDERLHSFEESKKTEEEYKFYRVLKSFCERSQCLNFLPGLLTKSINLVVFSDDQLKLIMYFMEYLRERYKDYYKETTEYKFPTWLTNRITLKGFKYCWSDLLAVRDFKDQNPTTFNDFQYEFEKKKVSTPIMVRGIRVSWLDLWDGDISIVGLRIYYENNVFYSYGTTENHVSRLVEIFLKGNEYINKIKYKSISNIKSITFYTSLNNIYGPYGRDEGTAGEVTPPSSGGFLAGIKGHEVWCAKTKIFDNFAFCWGNEYIIGK